jgi:hypothetical protein
VESGAGWEYWSGAVAGGIDDFAAIDALEVDRGDPEVGVSELALDDVERNAFAGHLDGMGVT